jgi:two-component system invasion response regulator UvrY
MIKVLLIDDHTLVRQGLRYLFNRTKEIQIVGEADTGAEGVRLARELQPTVVILDLKLPDISGLEVTERLLRLRPTPKVLIVTSADYLEFSTRLLAAGAHGYLSKQAGSDELISAIKTVSKDQIFISTEMANRLALARIDNQSSNIFSSLNQTELEMVMLTVRNVPAEVIAQRLHLTAQTVHGYRSRIFGKLGVDNDVGLFTLALREGLITVDEVEA